MMNLSALNNFKNIIWTLYLVEKDSTFLEGVPILFCSPSKHQSKTID